MNTLKKVVAFIFTLGGIMISVFEFRGHDITPPYIVGFLWLCLAVDGIIELTKPKNKEEVV